VDCPYPLVPFALTVSIISIIPLDLFLLPEPLCLPRRPLIPESYEKGEEGLLRLGHMMVVLEAGGTVV